MPLCKLLHCSISICPITIHNAIFRKIKEHIFHSINIVIASGKKKSICPKTLNIKAGVEPARYSRFVLKEKNTSPIEEICSSEDCWNQPITHASCIIPIPRQLILQSPIFQCGSDHGNDQRYYHWNDCPDRA